MSNEHKSRVKASLRRAIIITVFALVLTAASFHGAMDGFTHEQVAETTNETIGIFVVSRAINALVSVLQTSQIKLPLLASTQVGEMLDPINDAVERLSSILVWAVGSLLLQRILLEVAASLVFKWTLCSIALVTIVALLLMEWERIRVWCREIFVVSDTNLERSRDLLVRVFVVAAIFRFMIPLFIGISFLVSQVFLDSEIAKSREQLSSLKTQVSNVASSPSPDDGNLEKQKAGELAKLKRLEDSKAAAREEMDRLDATIGQLKEDAGWRGGLPKFLGGVSPGQELVSAWERRKELDQEMERIEQAIVESEDALECIDTRLAGGSCDSLLERISNASKGGMAHVRETFGKLDDVVMDITTLLVAIAIKNVLFPILFLIGALKCSLPVARHVSRLLCGFEKDAKKLKDTVRSHLEGPQRTVDRSAS